MRRALTGITARLIDCTEELNTLDAALGDADLGGTLASISKSVQTEIETLPDDLGEALLRVVKAFSRTSGSSFSGVVMAGVMRAGMRLRGRDDAERRRIACTAARMRRHDERTRRRQARR